MDRSSWKSMSFPAPYPQLSEDVPPAVSENKTKIHNWGAADKEYFWQNYHYIQSKSEINIILKRLWEKFKLII